MIVGKDLENIQVYASFDATPYASRLLEEASRQLGNIDWIHTLRSIKNVIENELSSKLRIPIEQVLVDVSVYNPAISTRVLMPYNDMTDHIKKYVDRIPVWMFVEIKSPIWGVTGFPD